MTSNGSESLNRIFKTCRCLPIVAIVEGTWYKCVNWFDERKKYIYSISEWRESVINEGYQKAKYKS
jgi:hypothetical protein